MDPEVEFLGLSWQYEVDIPPRAHRRPHKVVNAWPADVIEISDSDDDLRPGNASQAPIAGPSGARDAQVTDAAPLFRAYEDRAPSSSQEQAEDSEDAEDVFDFEPSASRSTSAAPSATVESIDAYAAQILEIIPDVDPEHVLELLRRHIDDYKDKAIEPVLHILIENPSYPKVAKGKGKGKRKRDDEDEDELGPSKSKVKIDYTNKNRVKDGGVWYNELALEQLSRDFPIIPKNFIKRIFHREGSLYVPTFFALQAEREAGKLSYKPNSTSRNNEKGKGRCVVGKSDQAFEAERAWLVAKLAEDVVKMDAELAEKLNEQEYEETGNGIECGCCFSTYPFDRMIQCPEAHLFCTNCMSTYCETLLGSHDAKIVCMDQSGCKLPFPESELRRFLPPKLLALYDRVKQRKEIEAAGLENLEECPFCEYKVVIENEQERLFRCENSECGAVTCRKCKKPDHLPKSCEEAEQDKTLDGRHLVEEAMTRALMRNCPKCGKAFVKESGCNKMSCPHCHALSCYNCRKLITGYGHFNQTPGTNQLKDPSKCPLWDSVEQRHADEVTAAAKQAIEDYKREHPEVDEKEIRVELPPARAAGPSNGPGVHLPAHIHHGPLPHIVLPARPLPPPPPPMPGMQMPGFPGAPGVHVGIMPGVALPRVHHLPPAYRVNINFEPRNMPMLPQPVPQLMPRLGEPGPPQVMHNGHMAGMAPIQHGNYLAVPGVPQLIRGRGRTRARRRGRA